MKIKNLIFITNLIVIGLFTAMPTRANINTQDKDGNTALMRACIDDKLENVQTLLKNKDIKINIENKKGQTALDLAQNSQIQIQEALTKHGAKKGSGPKKIKSKRK
jgi:hypothetical protein